jgi:imidazolonepropionase
VVIRGASEILTCVPGPSDPVGRIPRGVVALQEERVLAVGPEADVWAKVDVSDAVMLDADGGVVAPGFVDAHTHLVFGGSRAREYAARLTHDPAEVADLRIPTGIMATVEMTRRADLPSLQAGAAARLEAMLAHGTTTVESKSGYGLDTENERKLLEVNLRLQESQPVDVVSTFMGAHDFPADVSRDAYVDRVIHEMIPSVVADGLARFNDVYCDDGFFTVEQAHRILEAGRQAGLSPKIHADQYADVGAAALAADIGVISADHLNFASPGALSGLAAAGVIAVLMPLIDFAVRHPRPVVARQWVDAGLRIALATDLCPGGYALSMPLAVQFACRTSGLSPEEALVAATAGGAGACGLDDRGVLAAGKLADLQIWDVPALEDMVYRIGHNPVRTVIKRGKVVA